MWNSILLSCKALFNKAIVSNPHNNGTNYANHRKYWTESQFFLYNVVVMIHTFTDCQLQKSLCHIRDDFIDCNIY